MSKGTTPLGREGGRGGLRYPSPPVPQAAEAGGRFQPPSGAAGGTQGVSQPLRQGPRRPWTRGRNWGRGGGGLTPSTRPPLPPPSNTRQRLPPGTARGGGGQRPRSLTLASPRSRRWRSPAPSEPGHGRRRRPYVAGERRGRSDGCNRRACASPPACALRRLRRAGAAARMLRPGPRLPSPSPRRTRWRCGGPARPGPGPAPRACHLTPCCRQRGL